MEWRRFATYLLNDPRIIEPVDSVRTTNVVCMRINLYVSLLLSKCCRVLSGCVVSWICNRLIAADVIAECINRKVIFVFFY